MYVPSKGEEVKAFWLFNTYKINQFVFYPKIVIINGEYCYLSGCKLNNVEFLIIVSFNKPGIARKQRYTNVGNNNFKIRKYIARYR